MFLFSPLLLGKIAILTHIFQRGLVQPPTSHVVFDHLLVERKFLFFFLCPLAVPLPMKLVEL